MINEHVHLGNKIHSLRLELGETMEQFGKRFNTSKGTVNNWEKGRNSPNKENLLLLSKLAKTSVEDFLFGASKEDKENIYAQYYLKIEDSAKREFIKNYLSNDPVGDQLGEEANNLIRIEGRLKLAEEEYTFKQQIESQTTTDFLKSIEEKLKINLFNASLDLATAIHDYSLIEKIETNTEKELLKTLLKRISIEAQSIQTINEMLQKKAKEFDLV